MVDVDMSLTPPKVIGREVYLRIKGLFRLSKDLRPIRHPNILWKEEFFKKKDFMKVEDGGMHCKRYDGCCMKQQTKIPKAI